MAAVQQRVLNWLYSVLTSEYQDVNRTYNDVAQTLSHYSSLTSRTEVYTYENGASALLLQLSGTLPVTFRGTTYRFPIVLWIPHAYPRDAPIAYVKPTGGMIVRAGQHVDPQGKVFHPYLVGWAEFWDKSNVLDFLAILRDVFAKEPPVVARQQRSTVSSSQQPTSIPPPVPPLPPDIRRSSSGGSVDGTHRAPPPPPRPYEGSSTSQPARRDTGPPLPRLPLDARPASSQQSYQSSHQALRQSSLRYESTPPLPPQVTSQQGFRPPAADQLRVGPHSRPPPVQHYGGPPQQLQQHYGPRPPSYSSPPQVHQPQPQQWQQPPQQPQHQHKPAPPPDLLDEPLTLAIPTQSQVALALPPVPPNPEKDMLLHNLARALYAQRQHGLAQTSSSLPGLRAQHGAMLSSLSAMQSEIQQLESLSKLLNSNASILHTSLADADAVIANSQHRAPPGVDEILVAPTVVGNQLYELANEERSLGDALFILGRAVERGRIAPVVFAKATRGLAREWFLKKALVRKIGRGMGLAGVTR